jgi:hypothetical protein
MDPALLHTLYLGLLPPYGFYHICRNIRAALESLRLPVLEVGQQQIQGFSEQP